MRWRSILVNGGLLVFLVGLFFLAQGRGWVSWPRESFMVGNAEWVLNGSLIAVAGLVAILLGRRLPR